ncbi:MAP7 domain-containing protein 2a [Aulostomus maculatus]
MAKTVTSSNAITGEKMAPPSITLLPDKRSPTNGHSSPARIGKTTPSNSEKKPHINGHASPSHLAANNSNIHATKQFVEGYMKTDDRMRLAKERREERERSLAAREQLIREKERRARLQYERTVEERWRRLEEQRQKEELRRAAVEEKRRQQLEEERERLEALMRRSLERSLQLEQRSKRWSRGCAAGAGDSENAPLSFSAASALSHGIASPLPAVSESAPCSPHRSPLCNTLNSDHNRAGFQGGSQSTPNTPKKERLRRERRTASPGCGFPVRRSESPASVTRHLASPTTSKLASKIRAQSPSNQYHYSPTRNRPSKSADDKKPDDKKVDKHNEQPKMEPAVKKNSNINSVNPTLQPEENEISKTKPSKSETVDKHLKSDTSDKNQSPDRRDPISLESSEKKTDSNTQNSEKKKEPSTTTGKMAAGTTNAEEATRLLAERRRQARALKELEDKKREQEEEEKLKEEQKRRQLAEEQRQQEAKAQQVKEMAKREEEAHVLERDEEKRQQDVVEQQLQNQMNREKEKAKVQAQEDAERQRQDRELQAHQEEEERQLRKKRIEEIMKRTRKAEADLKEEQVETKSVSTPGEVMTGNAQVNEQAPIKAELKEQVTMRGNVNEAAAQMDNQTSASVKNNSHQVAQAPRVPDKQPDDKQISGKQVNKDGKDSCVLRPQERELEVNKEHRVNVKAAQEMNKEPTKVKQREGGVMNGGVKAGGSALMRSHGTAEVVKQQSLHVLVAEAKGGSQKEVIRPLPPPTIKLEPLDVSGSGDEVQSMEVSPASKEELISIPEFSPVNEIQISGMSNDRALEDLMDLTGSVTYARMSSEGNIGDCNKNLIEGIVSPMSDSKLIGLSPPSSNKLSIQ